MRSRISEIEVALKENNLNTVFNKSQQLTKYQTPQPVVKTIELGDGILTCDNWDINKAAADYFTEVFYDASPKTYLEHEKIVKDLFTMEDIEEAIKECDFGKAMG